MTIEERIEQLETAIVSLMLIQRVPYKESQYGVVCEICSESTMSKLDYKVGSKNNHHSDCPVGYLESFCDRIRMEGNEQDG